MKDYAVEVAETQATPERCGDPLLTEHQQSETLPQDFPGVGAKRRLSLDRDFNRRAAFYSRKPEHGAWQANCIHKAWPWEEFPFSCLPHGRRTHPGTPRSQK
jgi:hypothetical protein